MSVILDSIGFLSRKQGLSEPFERTDKPYGQYFLLVVLNVVRQGDTSATDCLLDPSTEEVTRAAPLPEPSCDNLK